MVKKLLLSLLLILSFSSLSLAQAPILVASFDIRANNLTTPGFNIANRAMSAHIFTWSLQQGTMTSCILSFQTSFNNSVWTEQTTGDCAASGTTNYLTFVTNYVRIVATTFTVAAPPAVVTINYAGYIIPPTNISIIPPTTSSTNSSDYDFVPRTPNVTLTGSSPATITLSPCPKGVSGVDTNHYLYISAGTGTVEAVLITGGTCVPDFVGTVVFTPANNHSGAWTLASATAGIKEALNAIAVDVHVNTVSTIYASIFLTDNQRSLICDTGSKLTRATPFNMFTLQGNDILIDNCTLDGNRSEERRVGKECRL